jgi:hypothetical protein
LYNVKSGRGGEEKCIPRKWLTTLYIVFFFFLQGGQLTIIMLFILITCKLNI